MEKFVDALQLGPFIIEPFKIKFAMNLMVYSSSTVKSLSLTHTLIYIEKF